jgi:2-polyprenyl-3-methyl-5-hydroxy-6-metoxy-1,4-benzoquinol methylase
MTEFTGERVIPGKVNEDLWAEHVSRYAFGRRFTAGKRVLDIGCGTGYGTAELAEEARLTVGLDVDRDAVEYASAYFPGPNFVQCSAKTLPFATNSFDVITAFEVIEHLSDWSLMLAEARRLLCPDGLLIVSTPNKLCYAEARGSSGPNPYHQHEFEFAEFRAALAQVFPYVEILLQDRVEAFAFHRGSSSLRASLSDARVARASKDPMQANFFVAMCSGSPIPDAPAFVYVPRASNLLRERETHIRLLEKELDQVKLWLRETMVGRDELIGQHKELEGQLDDRTRWALRLDANLRATQDRVVQLQEDFQAEQQRAAAIIAGLNEENLRKTNWALDLEASLAARTEWARRLDAELAESVKRLNQAETMVAERTAKAARLDDQLQKINAQIEMMRQSRWIKLGRQFGVGPDLNQLRAEES